ncbi:glycosyltransferase family 4 protein [Empedobacter falsenii]|uniref:glycosyltransferase family 4 protein n=1 Tax=Empedobacter TaxID=59734 RepID=UPI002576DCC4|nr:MULTISPECIES: glycosyltransferase family 4 protein [Empedobacter]MDM1063537.1 glycosyltransferase family 4 protein [Empedobacter falsenii]
MRIAILARVLFLSGVTTHIIDLSKELIESGHEVFVFTSGPEFAESEANVNLLNRLEVIGAQIVKIDFPNNSKNKLLYGLKMLKSVPIVHRKLLDFKIDVIHVHTPALSFIPVLLRKKYVKTIHIADLSLSILNRRATHEITISRETYKEAQQKFNYNEDELTLIFNGVDKRFSKQSPKENNLKTRNVYKINSDKIIIGIVGSIQYRKGHDVLLKAISKFPSDIKNKVILVILGEGNKKEEKWLSNLVTENFLENIVIKLPFQDPKPFYDIIDIFVLPSRLEGFPLVAIEAFLSGCCVVRSNVEGAYDQIDDGKTGFLFQNENVDELKDILVKLTIDDKLRMEVTNNGREFALQNFTSDIMAEKTIEVYQKVIN